MPFSKLAHIAASEKVAAADLLEQRDAINIGFSTACAEMGLQGRQRTRLGKLACIAMKVAAEPSIVPNPESAGPGAITASIPMGQSGINGEIMVPKAPGQGGLHEMGIGANVPAAGERATINAAGNYEMTPGAQNIAQQIADKVGGGKVPAAGNALPAAAKGLGALRNFLKTHAELAKVAADFSAADTVPTDPGEIAFRKRLEAAQRSAAPAPAPAPAPAKPPVGPGGQELFADMSGPDMSPPPALPPGGRPLPAPKPVVPPMKPMTPPAGAKPPVAPKPVVPPSPPLPAIPGGKP